VPRPDVVEFVDGRFERPNTRRSEIVLRWCRARDGQLYLREHLDYDDSVFDERLCGYLPLTKLPEPPEIRDLDDFRRALEERFDAHPLANQLPSTLDLVLPALDRCDALDVVRVSARYSCVVGVARGFGKALGSLAGGPFRGDHEPVELRRLARACLVMTLGVLDCHGSYGPWEHWAKELFDELPRYPSGKHASHDGGQHDEVCLEYDRLLVEYLRAIAELVGRALELPAEKLDARSEHITLPTAVRTSDEALRNLEEKFRGTDWFWQAGVLSALPELHGQPLAALAPSLSRLFSGESPVPLPEGAHFTSEGLAEGSIVKHLLVAVVASDLDLADDIRAAAEQRAADEAERAEERRRFEAEQAADPTRNLPVWLRVVPVGYWLALGALVLAAVVMCSVGTSRRASPGCSETPVSMRDHAKRIFAGVEARYGAPVAERSGRIRVYDGASDGGRVLPRFELAVDDVDSNPCDWSMRVAARVRDAGPAAAGLVAALDTPEVRRSFERQGFFEGRDDGSIWLVKLERLRTTPAESPSWLDDDLDLADQWARDWMAQVEAHSSADAALPTTMQFRPGHDPKSVLERSQRFLDEAGAKN